MTTTEKSGPLNQETLLTHHGKGHSLENKSQNDLVFIALIINN